MKIKLLISFLSSFLILLGFTSSIYAEISAEPARHMSSSSRDLYQTDIFTGSATYSYPLKVPKGTDDLTPDISLSYYSGAAHDVSAYTGMGWALNQDYIERDINYTVDSSSDDKYKLHFKGSTYELVYVSSESRYHTKIESYLKIEKLTGASNNYSDFWQITTQDGTVYRFGNGTNSEQVCNGRSYVYRWNIDLVTDIHSNHIYYSYSESNGSSYLTKIEYNTDKSRTVDFTYGSNPYTRPLYMQGCSIQESYQLSNIQVKANTSLVHQFDLNYATATNSGQLLQSITEKGSDGSSLPATTFEYKPEVKNWQSSYETWESNNSFNVNFTDPNVMIADVNADGLPDLIKVTYSGGADTYHVYKNTGTTWNTTPEYWLYNADIDTRPDEYWMRLIDVNGDSLPDIVKSSYSGSNVTWWVWKNTGTSWNTTAETWVNNASIDAHFDQPTDNKVELVDVTGDGLPDIVKTAPISGTYTSIYVWRNTGTSWNTTGETWINNVDMDVRFYQQNMTMADVNGDGLQDFVKVDNYGGTNNEWKVFYNTGNSWNTTYASYISNVNASIAESTVSFTDTNGDVLPEMIKVWNTGGANNNWTVYLNKGSQLDSSPESWANPIDANTWGETKLADANGDGLIDIIRSVNTGGSNNDWRVWKNSGNAPDLLSKVTTAQGGSISFDYKPSTQYDNTGADNNSDLPFPLWVVEKMTVKNGMTNAHATEEVTTYSYKDGLYDSQDREFRGFAEVNTTEPDGSKKKYVFNQDDIKKGMLAEVQHRDSSNNPYDETENTWSSSTSNGVTTVKLDTVKEYTYDGTASNPKIKQSDYQYDVYGNITKLSDKGDASSSADDRFIYNEYTTNTTDWIVNTPKHTYKNASNDSTKISESWFYYDSNTGLSDAPTKGDMTKKVDWLSGGTNPETTYTYDSHGNKITETDANNHTTTYTYNITDSTYTYPERVTNAKSQQTNYSYSLGTGNLLSQTDSNGFTTSYAYDVFGRVSKEIKPYDSSTYPTVNYTYSFDGVAPESVLVSKREVSSASATLDTYTYIDGLERKIQTKSEAEDTTKQIVINTFYDPNGQIKTETVPYLATLSSSYSTPDISAKYSDITYDPLGRPTIIRNPKGDSKTVSYDHWKKTTTNENGGIKREFKNAFDKITKVEEVLNATNLDTEYTYDSNDTLTKITDAPGNESTFVYDTLGRKTSQVDPDMGTWTYVYDGVGNMTSQTDARSITVARTYDELNRLTLVNYPNDTDTTYTYDGNSKVGTLTTVVDKAGSVTYSYDNRLRKTQESRTIDGTTKVTQLSYDALDRVKSTTNPDGEVISNTFNTQGEIASVSGVLTNIDYNALGKITKKDYANGLSTTYTYNNASDQRLNRIQTSSLQDLNYTYDNVGNINTIADSVLSKTYKYSYDDLDRLKTASDSASTYNYKYYYNSIGNLTKATDNLTGNDTNYGYAVGAGPHAITSTVASGSGTTSPATISVNNLINSSSSTGATSYTTSSITPTSNKLLLLTVASRTGISTNPNQPTVSGNGLTWVAIDTRVYDDTSSSRRRITLFRAMGASPTSGAVTIDFGGQSQTNYTAVIDQITGMDTSGTNGSGAIVQSANNYDASATVTSLAVTLAGFGSSNNATYGTFANGYGGATATVGSGFTKYGEVADSGSTIKLVSEFKTANDTSVDFSVGAGEASEIGGIAIEIKAGTVTSNPTAISISNKTTGSNSSSVSSANTASVTPASNKLQLLSVASRTGISTNPNQPTVSGNGLTWAVVNSVVYDDTSSSRRRITLFRAMGTSPTSGAITISFGGQTQTDINWSLDEVSDVDTSGSNGSGAIVQSATNYADTAVTSLTVTLGSFSGAGNATFGAFANGYGGATATVGSGFSKYGEIADTNSTIKLVSEFKTGNDTSVDFSVGAGDGSELGGIAVELKAAATAGINETYTYDANGNMTSNGTNCYQYNEGNQLDKVTKCSNSQTIAEYVYDYTGMRMVKRNFTSGTHVNTVTSWSDSFETKAIVSGSTTNTSYYFVNGQLIAKKDSSGAKTYFHNDHLGSATLVTNQAGTLVENTTYDPWGQVLSGGTASKFLYTGQEKDSETGLHYYNARYYDSNIRHFTQPDDLIQNVYNPQDLNRYSYVNNNPLNNTDPSGHAIIYQNGKLVSTITALPLPEKKTTTWLPSQAIASVLNVSTRAKGTQTTQTTQSNNSNQSKQQGSAPNIITLNQNIQQANAHKINPFYPALNISNTYNILWFINKVRDGGEWDYKNKYGKDKYENFGNFNYGLTGRAMGFSPDVLGRSAGAVQQLTNIIAPFTGTGVVQTKSWPLGGYPFGDAYEYGRSVDQEMIRAGAANYDAFNQ